MTSRFAFNPISVITCSYGITNMSDYREYGKWHCMLNIQKQCTDCDKFTTSKLDITDKEYRKLVKGCIALYGYSREFKRWVKKNIVCFYESIAPVKIINWEFRPVVSKSKMAMDLNIEDNVCNKEVISYYCKECHESIEWNDQIYTHYMEKHSD